MLVTVITALPVHCVSPSAFIVVLADEVEAFRVASDNNEPPRNGSFRVHCRRWTRQALSSDTILPSWVDVELQGVPTHAWEVSTAESLLRACTSHRRGSSATPSNLANRQLKRQVVQWRIYCTVCKLFNALHVAKINDK